MFNFFKRQDKMAKAADKHEVEAAAKAQQAVMHPPQAPQVQAEAPIIDLTPDMMIKPESKLIDTNMVIIKSSWDYKHCAAIGCNKALKGCCIAYRNPAMLPWFRNQENGECPTGPYQSTLSKRMKKVNPLKASKRQSR